MKYLKAERIARAMLCNYIVDDLFTVQPHVSQIFSIIGVSDKQCSDYPDQAYFTIDCLQEQYVAQLSRIVTDYNKKSIDVKKEVTAAAAAAEVKPKKPKAPKVSNFFKNILNTMLNKKRTSSNEKEILEEELRIADINLEEEEAAAAEVQEEIFSAGDENIDQRKTTFTNSSILFRKNIEAASKLDPTEVEKSTMEALQSQHFPDKIIVLQSYGLGLHGTPLSETYPLPFLSQEEKLLFEEIRNFKDDLHQYEQQQEQYYDAARFNYTVATTTVVKNKKKVIARKLELMSVYQQNFPLPERIPNLDANCCNYYSKVKSKQYVEVAVGEGKQSAKLNSIQCSRASQKKNKSETETPTLTPKLTLEQPYYLHPTQIFSPVEIIPPTMTPQKISVIVNSTNRRDAEYMGAQKVPSACQSTEMINNFK